MYKLLLYKYEVFVNYNKHNKSLSINDHIKMTQFKFEKIVHFTTTI